MQESSVPTVSPVAAGQAGDVETAVLATTDDDVTPAGLRRHRHAEHAGDVTAATRHTSVMLG